MSAAQTASAEMEAIFRQRMHNTIDWLAKSLSGARMKDVVGSADVPQLIIALARNTPSVDPAELDAGKRLARTAEFKRGLLERAGGALDTAGVRRLLGYKSAQAVHKAVASRRLLAVDDNGVRLFPAFQFDGSGIAPGVAAVLAATPTTSAWAVLQFMVEGDEGLEGDRPMELARGGQGAIERIVRFARALED